MFVSLRLILDSARPPRVSSGRYSHVAGRTVWSAPFSFRTNTAGQSPTRGWRNSRMVGYQGLSCRSFSQRHSGADDRATQTGTPRPPARWAAAVSEVITRSRLHITAAVSMNAPDCVSSELPRSTTVNRSGDAAELLDAGVLLQADQLHSRRPRPAAQTRPAESSENDRR